MNFNHKKAGLAAAICAATVVGGAAAAAPASAATLGSVPVLSAGPAVSASLVAQSITPDLIPGGEGNAALHIVNNDATPRPAGAQLRFEAPSGTTFKDATVRYAFDSEPDRGGNVPGTSLSADKKVLTVDHPAFHLAAHQGVALSVILVSDAGNTRIGAVMTVS